MSKVEGNAKYKLLKTHRAEFEATRKYDQLFNRWSKVKSSYSKSILTPFSTYRETLFTDKLKNDFRSSPYLYWQSLKVWLMPLWLQPVIHYMLSSSLAVFGAVFGGSRFITLGPTNATSVLLFAFFAGLSFVGFDGQVDKNGLRLLPVDCRPYRNNSPLAYVFGLSYMVKFISRTVVGLYNNRSMFDHCKPNQTYNWHPSQRSFLLHLCPRMVKHLFLHIGDLSLPAVAISLSTAIIYLS